MAPCLRPRCVGIAERGGLCAPHANGFDQHDGSRHLRCEQCRHAIKTGEWYQAVGENIRHVRRCKVHPLVAKERAARAAVA